MCGRMRHWRPILYQLKCQMEQGKELVPSFRQRLHWRICESRQQLLSNFVPLRWWPIAVDRQQHELSDKHWKQNCVNPLGYRFRVEGEICSDHPEPVLEQVHRICNVSLLDFNTREEYAAHNDYLHLRLVMAVGGLGEGDDRRDALIVPL